MKSTFEIKNWYALYTKPKHEKKALERLANRGYEVYCPMINTIKQWSDRKKKISVPLIPSYIFIKVSEIERSLVLNDPSILNYIFWLGKPAIIRNEEIDRLKGLISNEIIQEFEIRHLKVGEKININKGFLIEKNATIKKVTNNHVYTELKELGVVIILKKTDLIL